MLHATVAPTQQAQVGKKADPASASENEVDDGSDSEVRYVQHNLLKEKQQLWALSSLIICSVFQVRVGEPESAQQAESQALGSASTAE